MHCYEAPEIPMLFDLADDEGEVKNIATLKPDVHKELFEEMMRYFEEVGARIPKLNPDMDLDFYKKDRDANMRVIWGAFEGERPLEDDEI